MSIIEDGGDGVTMELEVQWDGNPSIILDIKTLVGLALPVQVVFTPFFTATAHLVTTFSYRLFR